MLYALKTWELRFNVWVGNGGVATPKRIENPEIGLKVERSWLQDTSVDPTSITLHRYNNSKWEQFQVNRVGEDSNYLYLKGNVSGYSSFAITGKAKVLLKIKKLLKNRRLGTAGREFIQRVSGTNQWPKYCYNKERNSK